MGLFDEMKDMAGAVEKAAAEHPDQVKAALAKLEGVVDTQTGGTHHDEIAKAAAQADEYIDKNATPKP